MTAILKQFLIFIIINFRIGIGNHLFRVITVFFICCLTVNAFAQEAGLQKYTQVQYIMGTLFKIDLFSKDKTTADRAFQKAFAELRKYDLVMSNYRSDSELSSVLKTASHHPTKISPELYDIFKESLEFSELSNGMFDITVGLLVKLWGFKAKNFKKPSPEKINQALAKTGYRNIYLNPYNRTVFLKNPGMEIDFGGIGKGYAIDKAVKQIRDSGITSGIIDSLSSQYYIGSPPSTAYWQAAIRDPRNEKQVIGNLKLKDKSVSTSGDYEQYFIENGIRYSHIISPATGYPLKGRISASTVIIDNSTVADMLSTAVLLLDDNQVKNLVRKYTNIRVYKIVNKGNAITVLEYKN